MGLLQTIKFITQHPLSRNRRLDNLWAFAAWQLGSRLVPGPVAFSFVEDARLFAAPGLTAATGHIYVGLQEFEDMAFVLHVLRPDDWFADVGANIGGYTVLAGAVVGANVVAFEPGYEARQWLKRNIELNQIHERVDVRSEAAGARLGNVGFSVDFDTTNAVLVSTGRSKISHVDVPLTTLDITCVDRCPTIIKIDVEGYETEVLRGAQNLLANPKLLAIVMELNGSGIKYGFDEAALWKELRAHRFEAYTYAPFERRLEPMSQDQPRQNDNVVFARQLDQLGVRLRNARRFNVRGWSI
jgi:FkbM family methyltransferase